MDTLLMSLGALLLLGVVLGGFGVLIRTTTLAGIGVLMAVAAGVGFVGAGVVMLFQMI